MRVHAVALLVHAVALLAAVAHPVDAAAALMSPAVAASVARLRLTVAVADVVADRVLAHPVVLSVSRLPQLLVQVRQPTVHAPQAPWSVAVLLVAAHPAAQRANSSRNEPRLGLTAGRGFVHLAVTFGRSFAPNGRVHSAETAIRGK